VTVPFWILVALSVTTAGCITLGALLWVEIERHAWTKKLASKSAARDVESWQRLRESRKRTLKLLGALRLIEQQATPSANATVRRMAGVARNAIAEHDDAVILEEARRAQ
jgi:hypothetical protein